MPSSKYFCFSYFKVITESEADLFINDTLYKSHTWTNDSVVKKLKLRQITKDTKSLESFEHYIRNSLSKSTSFAAEQLRRTLIERKGVNITKLQAFSLHLFPAIEIKTNKCADVGPGDSLPQFLVSRNRSRYIFSCITCKYYEQAANSKCKSQSKSFDGVKQMFAHGSSQFHIQGLQFLSDLNNSAAANKCSSQIMARFLGKPATLNTDCLHIFNPDIVNEFKDEQFIHRMSMKKLYECNDDLHCNEHEGCGEYKVWRVIHADKYNMLRARPNQQAILVPLAKSVKINGKEINIDGAIQSVYPSCTGNAIPSGPHPFQCKSCYKQEQYLRNLIQKRQKAKLDMGSRIGKKGMRDDYLSASELSIKQKNTITSSIAMKKENRELRRQLNEAESREAWVNRLYSDCLHEDRAQLLVDCKELFQLKDHDDKIIQIEVLKNLVGKLKSGRNHKFTNTIKSIAKMHKNWLGESHYAVLKEILGFPSGATVELHKPEERFFPGFNKLVIENASSLFKGSLVVESSDEARIRRSLEPRLSLSGDIELLGTSWSADPSAWPQVESIPKAAADGTEDDFSALKNFVDDTINQNRLASHVSVHTLNSVNDLTLHHPVICIWPTPRKGYTSEMLFKVQQKIRKLCMTSDPPIALIGHSTDSAAFSRSLAKAVMTPRKEFISQGVLYLALGIPEEQFMAPYFWRYPTIMYLDFEHNQRSCLRVLKYETHDLVLYCDEQNTVTASIEHLNHLREICKDNAIAKELTETDLILTSFFDQNSDAAYKVFRKEIIQLLRKHVPHGLGTALFIEMIICMMKPYTSLEVTNPVEIVRSVAQGLTMLRLWKRYLMLNNKPLTSKSSGKKKIRSNFITQETYVSLEIQSHAAIDHQLVLFLHQSDLNDMLFSLQSASTVSTERFIGQSQAKTNHLQSTNQEPTFADTLDRASKIAFNVQTMQALSKDNVNIVQRGSRKKKISSFKAAADTSKLFSFPSSYEEYRQVLKDAFKLGVQDAQQSMKSLPTGFQSQLEKAGLWEKPFSFDMDDDVIVKSVPHYDKNDIPISLQKHNNKSSSQVCNLLPSEIKSNCSTSDTDCQENNGMYINRSGEPIHLKTALKICIAGRDNISKERGMRHMVGCMTNHVPIPASHSVLPLRYVAVKSNQRGICNIMQVMCIEEGDERRRSASVLSKAFFRGLLLEPLSENTLSPTMRLSPWKSVKDIICGISMEQDPLSSNFIISAQSVDHVNDAGFAILQDEDVFSENEVFSNGIELNEDEFIIECILDRRLNKFEEEEYLVKFKDHPSCQNEWVHSSNIIGCIPFTTTSNTGRKRFHTTKTDAMQPPIKHMKFQQTSKKRKAIPLPSFSESDSDCSEDLPVFDLQSSQESQESAEGKLVKCNFLGCDADDNICDGKYDAPNIPGLKNYGHTCWLNSTVQAMRSLYPFICNTSNNSDVLLRSLWEICEIMNKTKKTIIEPKELLKLTCTELKFDQSRQQDASEVLLHILGRVQPNGIEIDWETRMTDCGHDFHQSEMNSCMMLPLYTTTCGDTPLLHSSTEECLNAYIQIEERLNNVCCPEATCKRNSAGIRKTDCNSMWKAVSIATETFFREQQSLS